MRKANESELIKNISDTAKLAMFFFISQELQLPLGISINIPGFITLALHFKCENQVQIILVLMNVIHSLVQNFFQEFLELG